MSNQRCEAVHKSCKQGGRRRGPSSYWMHDSELVFNELRLLPGDVFLDMGCGPGDYALHAADMVGKDGIVYALDSNTNVLQEVKRRSKGVAWDNIKTIASDMTAPVPVEDASVDMCFMSTSLHCMDLATSGKTIFQEVGRVLKATGRVAVLECKKEQMDFGPPLHMRISAEDVAGTILDLGFTKSGYVDLGMNYLVVFTKEAGCKK
ncbi:MAG: class I SAM-dependent methyltransferase [Desulfovibrio sp.]